MCIHLTNIYLYIFKILINLFKIKFTITLNIRYREVLLITTLTPIGN